MKLTRMIWYWGPVISLMGLIFWLSSRPSVKVAQDYIISFIIYKTLHTIEYAILFLFNYRAFRFASGIPQRKSQILSFLVTVIFAVTDEWHQTFIPTREGRARDVIIDALGGITAWILVVKLPPKIPVKLKNWAKIWL